jgi:hypothetical protein
MSSTRSKRIIRCRSFLFQLGRSYIDLEEKREEIETFARDVMALLPGQLDLDEVVSLRRYPEQEGSILRYFDECWNLSLLIRMQMESKPIAGRNFCLQALALAMDLGVDLHGKRLAILLSLHRRVGAESKLHILDSDIVVLIANMSLLE